METNAGRAMTSFEKLVENHSREIFGYLWRMTYNTHEAEDLLQDTFLRAYKAYPRLKDHKHLRAWLYKIATNTARSHIKREKKYQNLPLFEQLTASSHDVAEQVEERIDLQAVKDAVDQLPERQRAALLMHKFQGLSYAEIAAALNTREDAARANVYQAMKKLRAQFSEKEPQP
jgi:RNA polymerase sigma-70 factor (ECF subfamily)